MWLTSRIKILLVLASLSGGWQMAALAQSSSNGLLENLSPVTDALLRSPPDRDWPSWRRTRDGFGFSPLDQINKQNVADLELAWSVPLETGPNMATPLVHDGVMFLASTRDTVLAMDASSGAMLWSYKHESAATAGARIGIALHGDKVLVPTADLHMVALNSRTGEVIWDSEITTTQSGPIPYSLRSAPLIAGGKVIQGITATMVPEGGFIVGLDLETGEESWRFHTVARPGEPGGNTWNDLALEDRSGGSVWVPGSYDAELDLVYFGTAPTYDTGPLLRPLNRPGITNDALFTNSTLALRPATGELVWYYQHVANDQWDLDWVYERTIAELTVDGEQRKAIVTAGKMALFDAVDAATGEYLFSVDVGVQNLITAVDPETGAKTFHPNATPNAEDSHLLCPFANGGRNWPATAYNPGSKMLYVPVAEVCMMGGPTGRGGIMSSGVGMNPAPPEGSDGKFGRLQAINLETQQLAWNFREIVPPTSAALATAGGLVFMGSLDRSFKAFDDSNGEILWQTDLGDIPASFPISYSVDGKQYIAVVVGQPSLHANIFLGIITSFLGEDESPVARLERNGPALMVYALD